ncbi:hypothetical protein TorRG33x02_071240, partial [Trema orientale]
PNNHLELVGDDETRLHSPETTKTESTTVVRWQNSSDSGSARTKVGVRSPSNADCCDGVGCKTYRITPLDLTQKC